MIETVAEGLEKPDALPPLRIASEEVLEFLVTRKKVSQTWRRRIPGVHSAIDSAVTQLSLPLASSLHMDGADRVGFFDCANVLSQLLQTEPQTKTLLGYYSSPLLRSWNDLCGPRGIWRKENAHLADAAEELSTILKFGIPTARNIIQEANRK